MDINNSADIRHLEKLYYKNFPLLVSFSISISGIRNMLAYLLMLVFPLLVKN